MGSERHIYVISPLFMVVLDISSEKTISFKIEYNIFKV